MTDSRHPPTQPLRLLGIGVGPANLSLGALIEGSSRNHDLRGAVLFCERRAGFQWHPGQLFPAARMQTAFVRDLVTLADPTNRFSFLNYLREQRRLMQFLNSGQFLPTRAEFVQYFADVAQRLPSIQWSAAVDAVSFDPDRNLFEARLVTSRTTERVWAENLVVGSGLAPYVPVDGWVQSDTSVHVNTYLQVHPPVTGKRVVVVGGGQSGAEVVAHLLISSPSPSSVTWLTRRTNFRILDTGNFSRELHTAGYAAKYASLPADTRAKLLAADAAAESGISPSLADVLYQLIYSARHVDPSPTTVQLRASVAVAAAARLRDQQVLTLETSSGTTEEMAADVVIWCTGFREQPLRYLANLEQYGMVTTPPFKVGPNYALQWKGPADRNVYVQSLARHAYGVADTNFTMVCHRNMLVLNDLAGEARFDPAFDDVLVKW